MKNIKSIFAVFGLLIAFAFAAPAQNITFTSLDGAKVDFS